MELPAILKITYELCRKKQDQEMMFYEDQLSFMVRKYENLKNQFEGLDKGYAQLLSQVRQLVTKGKVNPSQKDDRSKKGEKEVSRSPIAESSPHKLRAAVKRKSEERDKADHALEEENAEEEKLQTDRHAKSSSKVTTVTRDDDELFAADFFASPQKKPPKPQQNHTSKSNYQPILSPTKLIQQTISEPNKRRKTAHETTPTPPPRNHDLEGTAVKKYHPPMHAETSMTPEIRIHRNSSPTAPSITSMSSKATSSPESKATSERMQHQTEKQSITQRNGKKPASPLKFVEVVRKKDERDALRGFQCEQCAAFYNAQIKQGILDKSKMDEFLKKCSRHKGRWTPPDTPEGFWDLTVRTPDEWKN